MLHTSSQMRHSDDRHPFPASLITINLAFADWPQVFGDANSE
jgi:hypothetical protein